MNTNYQLPSDFISNYNEETNIHYYQTNLSTKNSKITLQQNVICLLLEGIKEVFTYKNNSDLTNSSFFILAKGNQLMTEKTTWNNNYKSILLFFSDAFVLNFMRKNNININQIEEKSEEIKVLKKDAFLLNFERSLTLLETNIKNDTILLTNKIEEIFLYIYTKYTKEVSQFFKHIQEQNNHTSLQNIIKKHEDKNLTVEELAFLCNMSLSTFKRKFNEAYQTTPKQYFVKMKMQKATKLLFEGKRTVEIAELLGYETNSAFSKEFKKHFNVSPTEYKNSKT